MENKKKGGKSVLVHDLMSKGLTARKAAEAVNVVFEQMTRALQQGETVEIPGGSIQVKARKGKSRTKLQQFRNVQTNKNIYRLSGILAVTAS